MTMGWSRRNVPMTCASKFQATMASKVLENLAMNGVAK